MTYGKTKKKAMQVKTNSTNCAVFSHFITSLSYFSRFALSDFVVAIRFVFRDLISYIDECHVIITDIYNGKS